MRELEDNSRVQSELGRLENWVKAFIAYFGRYGLGLRVESNAKVYFGELRLEEPKVMRRKGIEIRKKCVGKIHLMQRVYSYGYETLRVEDEAPGFCSQGFCGHEFGGCGFVTSFVFKKFWSLGFGVQEHRYTI